MEQGCHGLNICGTTGEATSFNRDQRMALMNARHRPHNAAIDRDLDRTALIHDYRSAMGLLVTA